ncbi:MAG: GHMP kinase [Flavobacterium sp.]|nr:GHMP kinase [Flavobacterium sp.]
MNQRFYSNGKLLLTAEYIVLDGATALALPTKFGQDLIVTKGTGSEIRWISKDADKSIWFEGTIPFDAITNPNYVQRTDSVENTLLEIMREAYLLNPNLIRDADGYTIETNLTFPKHWGLGTSSTLINNIAQWLQIDPFKLLENSFGGSGYDIASAQHDSPILYTLDKGNRIIRPLEFNPKFAHDLYFVYLNKKQSSKGAIASYYNNKPVNIGDIIAESNQITQAILRATHIGTLEIAMQRHENLISSILEMETVKEALFPDFPGAIKSLGAWGGDFILATAPSDPSRYFIDRGFTTVIPFSKMVL